MNQGLTKDDWKLFSDLMIKANYGQLCVMEEEIDKEVLKREKR